METRTQSEAIHESEVAEAVRQLFIFFPVGHHVEETEAYIQALLPVCTARELHACVSHMVSTHRARRAPSVAVLIDWMKDKRRQADATRRPPLPAGDCVPVTEAQREAVRRVRELRGSLKRFPSADEIREALRDAGLEGEAWMWEGGARA